MTKIILSLLVSAFSISSFACMSQFDVKQVITPTSLAKSQSGLVIFTGDILNIDHEVFQVESTSPTNGKAMMLVPLAETGSNTYFQILQAGKIVLKKAIRGQPEETIELTIEQRPLYRCM